MWLLVLICCFLVHDVSATTPTNTTTANTNVTSVIIDEKQELDNLEEYYECTSFKAKAISKNPALLLCMCDLECIKYGDCCLDILISAGIVRQKVELGLSCLAPDLNFPFQLKHTRQPTDGYYMVTDVTLLNGTRVSCNTSLYIPVTCRGTRTTYVNIECADLNKEVNCSNWHVQLKCTKQPLYSTLTCIGYLMPPHFAELRYCDSRRSQPFVSECHVDYSIVDDITACRSYYFPVIGNNGIVYRNIFCSICNFHHLSAVLSQRPDPILVLTDISEECEKAVKTCDGSLAWMDFIVNKCRPIRCYTNKLLRGGECEYENRTAYGNSYQLLLTITINTTDRIPMYQQLLNNLMTSLSLYIWSTDYQVSTSDQIYTTNTSIFYVNIWFTVNKYGISLEKLEDEMFDLSYYFVFAGYFVPYQVNFKTVALQSPIFQSFSSNLSLAVCCLQDENLLLNANLYEPITYQLNCSYIEFDQDEYEIRQDKAFIPHLNILLKATEVSVYKDQLRVCFRTFLEKANLTYTNDTVLYSDSNDLTSISVGWYLSVVCITLSLVSLVLTFITYLRFPEMRNQPGRNNMALVVNLFLAQMTVTIGSRLTDQVNICPYIGILVHYLWLNVILWMNVCSFHMFKVFVLQTMTRVSNTDNLIQTLKYLVYANGLSILIIVATVITNYTISNGGELGYGGRVCYLSTNVLVAYCFVLPLGLVILANIVFFLWTVITIRRVDQTSCLSRSRDKINIFIYIRLSVVTGAFWLVSILTNVVNSPALGYIAILLNASQGVFLFWSIVINKTVLSKWKVLKFKEYSVKSSSVSRTQSSQL